MDFDPSKVPHEFHRKFVPDGTPLTPQSLGALYSSLKNRPTASSVELMAWLADEDELNSIVYEGRALATINYTRQTDNPDYKKERERFANEVDPEVKKASFELTKKYLSDSARYPLDSSQYAQIDKIRRNRERIFRDENVELERQDEELSQRYQATVGAMTVTVRGTEYTLQQAAKFLENTDREIREEAWRLTTGRFLTDSKALDDIYTQMVALRSKAASNAGFRGYEDYVFAFKNRFDYTPEDCERLHQEVERHLVPLSREIDESRRKKMGLEALRPWDMNVDPQGRPPLAPFTEISSLVGGCQDAFGKMDPEFKAYFGRMADLGLLDLESRKGKAPGGYQEDLSEARLPFIFMNAARKDNDVRTLFHESGHSFHSFLMTKAKLPGYYSGQAIPAEFAEVASMSMELFGGSYLEGSFYDNAGAARSNHTEVVSIIKLFTWVSTIDSFQRWVYLNPGHSLASRAEAWSSVFRRFKGLESYEGLDDAMKYRWHRQLHIFEAPFYYIEYSIATLGALGLWLKFRKNQSEAIRLYKKALSLGSSKPLPELFRAADLPWDMGRETVSAYAKELGDIVRRTEA